MLPFYSWVKNLCQKRVTGLGLSVFRIIFSLILMVEVAKVFYFRHLYFDPIPYIAEAELSFSLVLLLWLGVLFFLLTGFFTRTAAIINYVLVLVFFSSFTTLKYHFDAALIGLSFLLIVLPLSNRLSLDSLLYKLRTLDERERMVRTIYYFLPVLLVLCLQYFDSFLHKGASEIWLKGLGVWLPASLPNQVYTKHLWLLNQEWLIKALGYLVLSFEASFIFLLSIRKLRPWLVAFGIGMHLAIAFIFPIVSFGVTFAALYLLVLPAKCWTRLRSSKEQSRSKAVFTYSPKDLYSYRVKILLGHFNTGKKLEFKASTAESSSELQLITPHGKKYQGNAALQKATHSVWLLAPLGLILRVRWLRSFFSAFMQYAEVHAAPETNTSHAIKRENIKVGVLYFFTFYLVLAQLIKALNSPMVILGSEAVGISKIRNYAERVFLPLAVINTKLFGVIENTIYTGFKEGNYSILAVRYVAPDGKYTWLPIIDEEGKSSTYSFGRMFTKWSRVIGAYPEDTTQVMDGVVRYTSFWSEKHGIPLHKGTFEILAKDATVQLDWERDYIKRQLEKPWRVVGELTWQENKPTLSFTAD